MPWHMSAPRVVSHHPCDPIRVSFPYSPEGMGWPQKFCSDVTFLLVLPKEGVEGERVYGLAMVWVHPYQARVSMIDYVAKQLAQLASTGPDWPYALVQLNSDACHVPLPTEGHLSVMMEGHTSNVPCRNICQLEVCQLLGSGGLSRRTQWVSSSSGNISAWVAIQWQDYARRWINFLQVDLS